MKCEENVKKTIEVWQPHYVEPLSSGDLAEICANLTGFFSLLQGWDVANENQQHLETHA
jgi:hypothetical protein